MKKTTEQIIERIASPETIDFFNIQRNILITFLPYELAKPYLDDSYVENYDSLPKDEKWKDEDPQTKLMEFLPLVYKETSRSNFIEMRQALLVLKVLVWLLDDEFYSEIEPFYSKFDLDDADDVLKKVSNHFGYKPIIEDIPFEEIPE